MAGYNNSIPFLEILNKLFIISSIFRTTYTHDGHVLLRKHYYQLNKCLLSKLTIFSFLSNDDASFIIQNNQLVNAYTLE